MSLANKLHISWRNYLWSSLSIHTIASTIAAETAYPLTNMQSEEANKLTVIDMTAQTTVAFTDSGSENVFKAARCFAVHNHNLPSGATIRLRLYDAINQGGAVVYDSTALDAHYVIPYGSVIAGIDPYGGYYAATTRMKPIFSVWFDSAEYKSFKIDITSADGFTDDLLKIDKLWLGFAWQPTKGFSVGMDSGLKSTAVHNRKPGGGIETIHGHCYRYISGTINDIENWERHVLRHVMEQRDKGGDLLITTDPNDTASKKYEETILGRRSTDLGWVTNYYNGNSLGLALEEN